MKINTTRNLAGFPFCIGLSLTQREQILKMMREVCEESLQEENCSFTKVKDMTPEM
jgi:hypothetical protein